MIKALLLTLALASPAMADFGTSGRPVDANITNEQLLVGTTEPFSVTTVPGDQLLIGTTEPILIDDPFVHIPLGELPSHTSNNKFGRSQNVDATATDVWDLANATEDQALWVAVTAGTSRIHELYGLSGNDTSGGSGCRTVRVQGTGHGDMSVASETITMAGNVYVPTLNTYSRINRMNCLTFGSGEMNADDIFAIAQVDKSSQSMITAGFGQTLAAIWTCPLGHTCLVTKYYSSLNKSGGAAASADITLFTRANADGSESGWTVKHFIGLMTTGSSVMEHDFKPYFKISEKTDIKVQALGSTTNLDVSAGFDVIEVLD